MNDTILTPGTPDRVPWDNHRMIGFTGSRTTHSSVLAGLPQAVRHARGFVTGACMGMDAAIGRHCARQWPDKRHVVIVPADRSRIDAWWLDVETDVTVLQMAPGTSYRDRNLAIVEQSGQLIGFPYGPEHDPGQRRSGTWQTIRMARRLHAQDPVIMPLWLW